MYIYIYIVTLVGFSMAMRLAPEIARTRCGSHGLEVPDVKNESLRSIFGVIINL